MHLRPYQMEFKTDIYNAWNAGHTNVLGVLPTGAGKTVVFCDIVKDFNRAAATIAHRSELIHQISMSLAGWGVRHRIIAPDDLIQFIRQEHFREFKMIYEQPGAQVGVVAIDTLRARHEQPHIRQWANQVALWVQDEAHHVLKENKWGLVNKVFPHARGLGVTATPLRADGKGLGRHHDGLFDVIVEGPSMREMINEGYLSDYTIFCPQSDIDTSGLKTGANGDFTKPGLKQAAQKSHIVGDVVAHYLRIAPGKLGITFATDVETAHQIAREYNEAGVRAEAVDANTPTRVRAEILRRFRAGEIKQMVNVDLFGEGFDLPALEVVSMARPTASFNLFAQQFGRMSRPLAGKEKGILIDHVSNVRRHCGPPDVPKIWTLDRRDKRASNGDRGDPIRECTNEGCWKPYSAYLKACPYCGFQPEPQGRSKPEFVDGDLLELDVATLAAMRGEISTVTMDPSDYVKWLKGRGVKDAVAYPMGAAHRVKQESQKSLRGMIAWWAGVARHDGMSDSEIYRKFWHRFDVDIGTAQALGKADAGKLEEKIRDDLSVV